MDGPFLCDMGRTIQVRSNGNRIRIGAAGLSSFRPPPAVTGGWKWQQA